ncbi:MAG TPA: transposase [Chloroflexota bacterium]|nr:transposase [Chloroflexota bacterium]HUM67725.1 transposase [Chloroflexota bacterium]
MRNINHQVSRQIVDLAVEYPHPLIALENLDGIAHEVKGVKQFRQMIGSWAFKQLTDMIVYKAARKGIDVIFVDPKNTSKTCHRCGHCARGNRVNQHLFRCQKCGLETNADRNAAHNIAAAGLRSWQQGRLGTARPDQGQTGDMGHRPDRVKAGDDSSVNPNLASSL